MSSDSFSYGGKIYSDTIFNRIAALACTAVYSTFKRTVTLRDGNAARLSGAIIDMIGSFSIIDDNPEVQILGIWDDASRTAINERGLFFNTFLIEVSAAFRASVYGKEDLVKGIVGSLLPQCGVTSMSEINTSDAMYDELKKAFNLSFAFIPKNFNETIQRPEFCFMVPWLILNHADFTMVEKLMAVLIEVSGGVPSEPEDSKE